MIGLLLIMTLTVGTDISKQLPINDDGSICLDCGYDYRIESDNVSDIILDAVNTISVQSDTITNCFFYLNNRIDNRTVVSINPDDDPILLVPANSHVAGIIITDGLIIKSVSSIDIKN